MNNDIEITLLSTDELLGDNINKIKKHDILVEPTDLAIVTGGLCIPYGWTYTRSDGCKEYIIGIDEDGKISKKYHYLRSGVIRPKLNIPPPVFNKLTENIENVDEIEYGEYPQYAASSKLQEELENEFQSGRLKITGNTFTFDGAKYNDTKKDFKPITYLEYKYKNKKYVRININSYLPDVNLSNGINYECNQNVWLEVIPVIWIKDQDTFSFISKKGLVSGIQFESYEKKYNGDFSKTKIKKYLDNYMINDLLHEEELKSTNDLNNIFNVLEEKTNELPENDKKEYLKILRELKEEININKKDNKRIRRNI